MPRTLITAAEPPGSYSYLGQNLVFTAGDPTNDNRVSIADPLLVHVRNVHATDPLQVVIRSAIDPYGRTQDITETLVAGALKIYGVFQIAGWRQTDGCLWLDPETDDIEFSCLKIR